MLPQTKGTTHRGASSRTKFTPWSASPHRPPIPRRSGERLVRTRDRARPPTAAGLRSDPWPTPIRIENPRVRTRSETNGRSSCCAAWTSPPRTLPSRSGTARRCCAIRRMQNSPASSVFRSQTRPRTPTRRHRCAPRWPAIRIRRVPSRTMKAPDADPSAARGVIRCDAHGRSALRPGDNPRMVVETADRDRLPGFVAASQINIVSTAL
ncbi:hypothetical protein SAMN04490239_0614 [Rhodococcus koreensis]|uniref:Uncharacterized protein n=1 Tax=Rhodococcus koreensis TaxID=99653 RepID=A0A1H4IIA9_9NOCA|nr:hypothetical protein SAMN04490239_0614 [Rhodococcus koreensis]